MTTRKTFSKEFKLEAVRQLEQGSKGPAELALDLGIRRNMLYKWQEQVHQYADQAFQGPGRRKAAQSDEVAQLRKELADVKQERDILKKAAAYFARDLK